MVLCFFGRKMGIDFVNFGIELDMIFKGMERTCECSFKFKTSNGERKVIMMKKEYLFNG